MNPVAGGTSATFTHSDGHTRSAVSIATIRKAWSCASRAQASSAAFRRWRPHGQPFLASRASSDGAGCADDGVRSEHRCVTSEMRSFVCGQCHVEYYCGPKTTLFYPWNNGLTADQIESYYDSYKFPTDTSFYDWTHAETGANVLKAQHPEFELWSQGVHARSGVACADRHMPYKREGAVKVSDHWVRSPLLNISRATRIAIRTPRPSCRARVDAIQARTQSLLSIAAVPRSSTCSTR